MSVYETPDNDQDNEISVYEAHDNDQNTEMNYETPDNNQDDEMSEELNGDASETFNPDNVTEHVLRVSKIHEVSVISSNKIVMKQPKEP
ncbi:9214_t:CDS:2 [Racocetra fulgida]|uniref:9214_t:CDS:1 n=1 Tax=Racocetra fulgida TaxID=60492 RepID=A0A9N9F600_9GLOM|nr:9214_t:CDS:2 [Racocetra fulgida]